MTLHPVDLIVLGVYLLGITWLGVSLRRRQGGLDDYFLAGGELPWWAIGFSIVAAETSVLTLISAPGLAYAGNFGFLQLVLGYLVARIAIALLLIPAYFRGKLHTAYELLQRRFGSTTQSVAALIFLGGRSLAEGVRVYALVIVTTVIVAALPAGMRTVVTPGRALVAIALLTLLYTFYGGMRAVVWTDCIQIALYVGCALASLALLLKTPGVTAVLAASPRKFQIFDFAWSWTRPYTFWSGLLGGAFLTMATHGTDQLMVQRLLAARNQRDSQWALLGSWVVILFQFSLFLAIGAGLYALNTVHPGAAAGSQLGGYDRLYPRFVAQSFGAGWAGLGLAAMLAACMSNWSAALNALSSSAIYDFYRPHLAPGRSEAHYLRMSRLATVGWMAVLGLVAYSCQGSHSVLELGLTVLAYPFSAILGAFLLGTRTRRANARGVLIGMAAGIAGTLTLAHFGVAYTWFAVAGTLITCAVGYGVSCMLTEPRRETHYAG